MQAIDPQAQVDWYPGVTGGTTGATLTTVDPASVAAAKNYDAVVVVAGTDQTTGSEANDRTSLALPGAQAAMISQVEAANPHTVVYLETMGEVDTSSFAGTSPALLWSSYNGQRQGKALADVLLGRVSPSGHLPFTWYADASQLPPDHRLQHPPHGHHGWPDLPVLHRRASAGRSVTGSATPVSGTRTWPSAAPAPTPTTP